MFKKTSPCRETDSFYSSAASSASQRSDCSNGDLESYVSPRNESIGILRELEQERVSSVLNKLESIQQLAGDAKVLRRKETREHNSRRMHIAQFFSLLLEEAEFNTQAVRQRNVVALLEGIKSQNAEVYFFSVEEARMKLAFGPSVKLRDALARPHRYADKLLVDMEVLDRMLTELSTSQIQDLLNKGGEYLTYMQTTYQVKPVEEKDSFHIKNASGLAVYGQSVFVADSVSHCIWQVSISDFTAQGNHDVELYAGVLRQPGFQDGPLLEAKFRSPVGIAVSEKIGKVFVADSDNHSIREIDLKLGIVSTIRIVLSPSTTEILGACFFMPKGLCLIHGDRSQYQEMEAVQDKKVEEYKEYLETLILMAQQEEESSTTTSSSSSDSRTLSESLTSSCPSFSGSAESSTLQSSSSSSSSTSENSSAQKGKKGAVHTGNASRPKASQRHPNPSGQSLEQSLSHQWMKNYTVLHEMGWSPRSQRPKEKRLLSPVPPKGSPSGTWRSRRTSSSEPIREKDEVSLMEVRLAVTCDHCVWYVDPHSGRAHVIAGHPSQYGYMDQRLGLAARFSSPKGVIAIRSVLFIADYWNNVIRTINLYTTKVDTVVDFNPQGPVAIGLSESGVIYIMDSDCIHYSNILRIMSLPCDGDGNSISSPTMFEDRFWYQSCFSQPRTRSSSIASESTKITKNSEVWDAYRNKSTEVWMDNSGRIHPKRPMAIAPPARDNVTNDAPSNLFTSGDLQSRLEEHLHQSTLAAEEKEEETTSKDSRHKKRKRKKKKKKKKKRKKRERKEKGSDSDDDPMYIDPRLLQGCAPNIRISNAFPDEPEITHDREDIEVLMEDDKDGQGSEDGAEKVDQQDRADPLAEALRAQLQHLEAEDLDPQDAAQKEFPESSRENTRTSLPDRAGKRKSSLLLPGDAIKRAHSPGSKSPIRSPLRPRSPGIIDTDDHVERTKIQLHTMGKVASRRGSFQDTPMTLSDLGITDRKGSMSMEPGKMRRGSWKQAPTPTTLAGPVKESSSANTGATAGFVYQRHNWNNGEYKIHHLDPQEKGPEAAAVDPEAGTVMVSGGKAFYRTDKAWSQHKSPNVSQAVSQNPSRSGSRRPSEEAINPKKVVVGEDEDGKVVDFCTDLLDRRLSYALQSRRDSKESTFSDSGIFPMSMKPQADDSLAQSQRTSAAQTRSASKEGANPQTDAQQKADTQVEAKRGSRVSGSFLEIKSALLEGQGTVMRRKSIADCASISNSRRGSLAAEGVPTGGHRGSVNLPGSRRASIATTGDASTGVPLVRRGSLMGMLGDEVARKVNTRASLEIPMGRRNSLHSGPGSRRGSLNMVVLPEGGPIKIEDKRSSLLGSRRGSLTAGGCGGPEAVVNRRRSSLRGSLTLEGPEAVVHRRSIIDRRGSVGLNIMPTVLDHGDEKEDGESNESDSNAEEKKSAASSLSGSNTSNAHKSSSKSASAPSEAAQSVPSPSLRSPTPGGKGAVSDITARDLKKDVTQSDKDETTSLGSDVETRLCTTDPSPFTVCVSPDSRAATAEPDRDISSPINGARRISSESTRTSQAAKSIMSLAKVPFTRDLDVTTLEENMLKKSTDQLPTTSQMQSTRSATESLMNRRMSNITSSAIGGTYKISPAPVSKVWRPVALPEPLSSAHRTKRKYPNTPLALVWYENNGENLLFAGLFSFPTLLKIIPPKHHEPDKGGRFNVLPIDSQRVLLADESGHQIWLFNHHQHVLKHLAGCGKRGHVDGPLETCRMSSPCALTLDPRSHYIYVADRGNHVIRKIDLMSGLTSTAVGNGFRGNTDGSNRLRQCLDSPFDVSFSEPHYLIISCADNAVRSFNLKTQYLKTILVGS